MGELIADRGRRVFSVEDVRRDFPILASNFEGHPLVYLDSAATAQKPRCVIDRIVECYESCYANVHRGIHTLGDRVTVALEESRERIRHWLHARTTEEIIFTSGTTASINLVAQGWGRKFLKPGDEILLSIQEHHSNLVPWQQVAQWTGATLKFLPLTEDGRLDLEAGGALFTSRTRMLAVTAMSNMLGTINPIRDLARRVHDVGGVILVDGAQSAPHGALDVQDLNVDFFAFSGHKVYGPSGIGVLYGRARLLEEMDPFLYGGNMIREVFTDHSTWGDLPAKFEAGTLPIVPAIALGTAIEYLEQFSLKELRKHESALVHYALERLGEIPGLRIYGPGANDRGPLVSFTVEGIHPHDLAELLNTRGIAVRAGHHCTMPLHQNLHLAATTRASFGLYNTLEEVDALVNGILHARRVFRLK